MATYTVARAKHATLTGSAVDTVILTGVSGGIQVVNRATTGAIYVTFDGTSPTVAGDDTIVIPFGTSYTNASGFGSGTWQVKLISSNADAYSVQAK